MIDITINQSQKRSRNVTVSFWKRVFEGSWTTWNTKLPLPTPPSGCELPSDWLGTRSHWHCQPLQGHSGGYVNGYFQSRTGWAKKVNCKRKNTLGSFFGACSVNLLYSTVWQIFHIDIYLKICILIFICPNLHLDISMSILDVHIWILSLNMVVVKFVRSPNPLASQVRRGQVKVLKMSTCSCRSVTHQLNRPSLTQSTLPSWLTNIGLSWRVDIGNFWQWEVFRNSEVKE